MNVETLKRANEIMSEIISRESNFDENNLKFDDLTKVSFQFKKGLYFHLDFDPDDLPKSIKESIKIYFDNIESENNNRIEQLKKELDGL